MTIIEEANYWVERYGAAGAVMHEKRIIVGLLSEIEQLKIQVIDRGESYSVAMAEMSRLQSLFLRPGDGACNICGTAPAVPALLCAECRQ